MLPLLLSLLASTPAQADDWSDFSSAFPSLPCADGWAGCIVDSRSITAEPVAGEDGVPMPSDLRLSWFNLDSQPAFDPFGSLSAYTDTGPRPSFGVVDTPTPPVTPEPLAKVDLPKKTTITEPTRIIRPPTAPTIPTTPPAVPALGRTGPADLLETCGGINTLQPDAMLGHLTQEQVGCIDEVASHADRTTERSKASRMLLIQAHAKRDTATWAKLARRHLDEIERSDPDIALSYALHLSRSGGDPSAILKWSDVALDNRHLWTGGKYTRNTLKLRALKTKAAYDRWKSLEEAHASGQSVDQAERERWRTRTVTMAREWYDYSVSAGATSDKALGACIAAAGTEDACR